MKIHNKYLYFFKGKTFVLSQAFMLKYIEFEIGKCIFYNFYTGDENYPLRFRIEKRPFNHNIFIPTNTNLPIDLISLKRMIIP